MKLVCALLLAGVSAYAQHAVQLSGEWQDDTADIAGGATASIYFQRSTTSGSGYVTVGSVSVTCARRCLYTYSDVDGPTNALQEGTTYYYVAFVQDSNGNSTSLTAEIAVTIPTVVKGKHLTVSVK